MAEKKPKLSIESGDEGHKESKPTAAGGKAADATVAVETEYVDQDEGGDPGAGPSRKGNPFKGARTAVGDWLSQNFPGHEHAVFGAFLGLLVAVLIFVIGFWQALFVTICIVVGFAIGQYVDGDPTVANAVRKFFGDNN